MKVKVLSFQSLADIAVRYTGNMENLVAIAAANDLALDADLAAGQEIEIPEDDVEINTGIVRVFKNNSLNPASADTLDTVLGGIDYMGIQIDFWVR